MRELFPLSSWSIHHWSWWGDVGCGGASENQPFKEADEVTVRGNVTDVLPAIDQHQQFQPKRAQPLPLGVGVGRKRTCGPSAAQKRETQELHDGAAPTATAQLAGAAKMAPARLPFRRSGSWLITLWVCLFVRQGCIFYERCRLGVTLFQKRK